MGSVMSRSLRGIAAALGFGCITACSTAPEAPKPAAETTQRIENPLFGERDPQTGCFVKRDEDGNVRDINCPMFPTLNK